MSEAVSNPAAPITLAIRCSDFFISTSGFDLAFLPGVAFHHEVRVQPPNGLGQLLSDTN